MDRYNPRVDSYGLSMHDMVRYSETGSTTPRNIPLRPDLNEALQITKVPQRLVHRLTHTLHSCDRSERKWPVIASFTREGLDSCTRPELIAVKGSHCI